MDTVSNKYWIINCNTAEFNIDKAYLKYHVIDWKQTNKTVNCKVDDIVYIYITNPYKYIKYKAKVIATNKPFSTIDDTDCVIDNSHYKDCKNYMEIEFLYRFENELVPYSAIQESGVGTVQGGIEIKKDTVQLMMKAEEKDREIQRFDGAIPDDLPANHWSLGQAQNNYISDRVLFCSITRMDCYKGVNKFDVAYGGGQYIKDNETGYEVYNFLPVTLEANNEYNIEPGEYCFGFVEVGLTASDNASELHFEHIVGCGEFKGDDKLEDCLVIFNAPKASGHGYNIVGWYNHATIYRYIVEKRPGVSEKGAYYFVAKTSDCTLLSPKEREREYGKYWDYPQNKLGFSGRSHIWYADYTSNKYSEEVKSEIKAYRDQIIDKIENSHGENIVYKTSEELKSALISKLSAENAAEIKYNIGLDNNRHVDLEVNVSTLNENATIEYEPKPEKPLMAAASKLSKEKYRRDNQRAYNALKRANYCCEFDPNHPSFIRKSDNTQYTEAHHLVPFSFQDQFSNSLDVEANIVSLCSNCHNQIHFGRNPEEILVKLYEERKDELLLAGIKITDFKELLKYYK